MCVMPGFYFSDAKELVCEQSADPSDHRYDRRLGD